MTTTTITDTLDIVLDGTLIPHDTSPLATSPMAVPGELDTRSKYPEGGPRTQRLPRLQLPVEPQASERAWSAYFPASGIRGHLRRLARSIFHAHHGVGMNVEELRYLTIGGVKGSGSESAFDLGKAKALRERLPLISVFGATSDLGNSWVAGKLSVHHAIPVYPLTPQIISGVRTDDLKRDPNEVRFLNEDDAMALTQRANAERKAAALRREKKDATRARTAAKRAKDADAEARAEAELTRIEEELARLSDTLGADVSVQMPLDGYEVIPPNTPLKHMFRLNGATPAELGLFLMTLDEWSHSQGLGAHTNHGCGIVRGQWDVRTRSGLGDTFQPAGRITLNAFENTAFEGAIAELYTTSRAAFLESVERENSNTVRAIAGAP